HSGPLCRGVQRRPDRQLRDRSRRHRGRPARPARRGPDGTRGAQRARLHHGHRTGHTCESGTGAGGEPTCRRGPLPGRASGGAALGPGFRHAGRREVARHARPATPAPADARGRGRGREHRRTHRRDPRRRRRTPLRRVSVLPSARLLLLLALAAPLFLVNAPLALLVDLLLLVAAALDAARTDVGSLQVRRRAPRRVAFGEAASVSVVLENQSNRRVRVRLTDDLPPALARLPIEEDYGTRGSWSEEA